MEFAILLGIAMIWAVAIIIAMMTVFGYDVKSRGFGKGFSAASALPRSGIGLKAYIERRGEHPVTEEVYVRGYRISMAVSAILTLSFIVFIIFALSL